jgi:hypothetical protein
MEFFVEAVKTDVQGIIRFPVSNTFFFSCSTAVLHIIMTRARLLLIKDTNFGIVRSSNAESRDR